jgi:hypothetical protein
MNSEEAGYAARRAFGNTVLLGEQARDSWSWTTLELLLQNLRIGIRTLARTPGFAFVSILVIAIGIGANVALFTVVRSVLMKPLPFVHAERLVRLYVHSADDKFPYNEVAGGISTEWKKQSHGFSDLAIVLSWPQYNLSGTNGQLPERVPAAFCSWNLLPMLGVEPLLGRGFTAADDQPSASATAILSWGLWKRRFGGDPAILNQTIHLDGKPYTVIGIMPSWFAYPVESVQLWTPIYHEQFPDRWAQLDSHMFVVIGRLKPVAVVGDTRFLVAKPPEPMMYFPLYKGIEGGATLAVRGIRHATSFALPIRGSAARSRASGLGHSDHGSDDRQVHTRRQF